MLKKVAIGPMFSDYGGVAAHIKGIQKYSSYDVVFVPKRYEKWLIHYFSKVTKNQLILREYYMKFKSRFNLTSYDVLHSHANPTFTEICNEISGPKTRWVHTYHMIYFEEDYDGQLQPWQKKINKVLVEIASKADIKISVAEWLRKYLVEEHSIDSVVIPNGFDYETCKNAKPDDFKKRYNIDNFVFYNGSMEPRKNPGQFVELAQHLPDTTFVMIGQDLSKENIETKLKKKVPNNITIFGVMEYEEILNALAACKVYVMTTKREGLPTALLEAMGLGKPVVAPDVPGCVEAVGSKEYGFIYDSNSLDDLVENTCKAMESRHVGENARKRVLKVFDWKVLSKKIDKVYSEV